MDDFTPLGDLAITLHEMYTEYVRAGFTESQAMYLIGKQVEAAARPQGDA
jgi:hypothetical protein